MINQETASVIINNIGQLSRHATVILLVFVRIYATFSGCTLLDKTRLPGVLRTTICLMLAVFITSGGYFHDIKYHGGSIFIPLLIIKEAVFGYLLGNLFAIPFLLIESVGKIFDQQRGEQFAGVINPLTQNLTSSSGKLMFQGFIVYFIAAHGLDLYLDIIFKSFTILKLDDFIPVSPLINMESYINLFSGYCSWMIIFAFPIILCAFIIDFILGIIGSFIPQLNVTILSIPIKSIAVLFLLIFVIQPLFTKTFSLITSNANLSFPG